MSERETLPFDCRRARDAVHAILDGETLDGARQEWLGVHLRECAGCREFDAEMRALQGALRELPGARFPEAALDDVWERTLRSDPARRSSSRWRLDWRSCAAAAVLTAAAFGLWHWQRSGAPDEPRQSVGLIVIDPERLRNDPEYARRITEETRRVLGLTSDALRRTERTAVREILGNEVGRALEKVPLSWPAQPDEQTKRNRQRENEL
jgi:hypothetical protein